MRKLSTLLFLFFLISCSKEELPVDNVTVETRIDKVPILLDGQGDNVFYRGSLSLDNYLLTNKDGTKPAREHTAYNSSKIKLINFASISNTRANIGGVVCSKYVVSLNFTDGSVQTFNAFSKDSLSSFIYTPKNSLLSGSNQCNYIKWVQFGNSSNTYNEYLNIYNNSVIWDIKCGTRRMAVKVKDPISKSSAIFNPGHKH